MEPLATPRAAFDPPPPRGHGLALALALSAHLLLVLALAWGLHWKKTAQDQAVEAELWSATAQIAAAQTAHVRPLPTPPPVAPPHPTPAPQVNDDSAREAELVLEQQKKREQAQAKAKAAEQQAAAEAAATKAADQKIAAAKAAEQKARDRQDAERRAREHDAAMRRMTALANADQSGMTNPASNGHSKTSNGTASRNAGPSADYGARVAARIRTNITYPDLNNIQGNPCAEVLLNALPDGTIVSPQLHKTSGVLSWDQAVLRAIDKTQILPRDVDGSVPSSFIVVFGPHDDQKCPR